jgi:purine-binding chemotaxis protein CheW
MNHDTQRHQEQLLRYAQDLQELMERNDRLEQSFKKVQPPNTIPAAPLRYQTFSLGSQIFAMDQLAVREVIQHPLLAAVPLMPALRGVKNGRGQVVPLIDLQLRTGPASSPTQGLASALIFEAQRESLRVELGLMSDSVGAIVEIPVAAIEPLPQAGAWIKRGFMRGMVTVNDESIIILEPSHALTRDDMVMFADQAESDSDA